MLMRVDAGRSGGMAGPLDRRSATICGVEDPRWLAVLSRDARADGTFVFAVRSTGIYCRPSCPARRPGRAQVVFFPQPSAAEHAGFRACRRCRPNDTGAARSAVGLVEAACRYIEAHLDGETRLATLAAHLGHSPHHVHRVFRRLLGITPREYADACRLDLVRARLRAQEAVAAVVYDAGFGSSSRLYERAPKHLGMTPAAYRRGGRGTRVGYVTVATPLGRLLVGATPRGRVRRQPRPGRRGAGSGARGRVSGGGAAPRRRPARPVGGGDRRAPSWPEAAPLAAARHPGDRVSAPRVGGAAVDPLRRDALVRRDRAGARRAVGDARGGARVRRQSGGAGDPVPPRRSAPTGTSAGTGGASSGSAALLRRERRTARDARPCPRGGARTARVAPPLTLPTLGAGLVRARSPRHGGRVEGGATKRGAAP